MLSLEILEGHGETHFRRGGILSTRQEGGVSKLESIGEELVQGDPNHRGGQAQKNYRKWEPNHIDGKGPILHCLLINPKSPFLGPFLLGAEHETFKMPKLD